MLERSLVFSVGCLLACTDSSSTEPTLDAGTDAGASPDASAPQIECFEARVGDTITILHQWDDGGQEQARFRGILKPLVDACGIVINDRRMRDIENDLQAQVENDALDVLVFALAQLAGFGARLRDLSDLGAHRENYSDFFISSGTVNGHWLGLPIKADLKTLIWYSPRVFAQKGYQVPKTWEELLALTQKMASAEDVPWSMGLEAGGVTGWTGTDFIQDILLVQNRPDYVTKIIAGTVAYNDPGVREAWERYGTWAKDPKYALGGANGTLSTSFRDAIFKVFVASNNAPEAMMVKQSGFVRGELEQRGFRYPEDYDFFFVPSAKGLQAGSDWLMVFKESQAVRALVRYLSSNLGGATWAKSGLDLSPNRSAAGNYVDPVLSKTGEALANLAFTPDIGDTIPGTFQAQEWKGVVDYLKGGDLNAILTELSSAQSAALK